MVEVREVLRLWLRGHGYRKIGELVRADRKTVRPTWRRPKTLAWNAAAGRRC